MLDVRYPQILVVEDVMIAQKIASIIFGQYGCAVVTANSGRSALEAVTNQKFDFILMDLGLPDTDGVTLTTDLRAQGGWLKEVPIVAMTAHTDSSFKGAASSAGITDFYIKPMTLAIAKEILDIHVFSRVARPDQNAIRVLQEKTRAEVLRDAGDVGA